MRSDFGAPVLARYRDAGRMDHMRFDPLGPQPPRQPEAVAAGFEGHRYPLDRLARLDRFVTPAVQEPQQQHRIGGLLLQRIAGETRNQPGRQPRLRAQFNHRHQRAILLEGDEGLAQIILLHGALR